MLHQGDRELARRMLAGDDRAFEEFFEEHFQRLYRFALTRLRRDPDAAEEAAQSTLCRAITKLSTYRGEAALFTWLCTFCRHEIHALIEKRTRQPRRVDLIEEIPEVRAALESLALPHEAGPELALRRLELARRVQLTLDRLPPHYGNALEWKYLEGLSVKSIATRMALSPKAAESILTRAREAFREGFAALSRPNGQAAPAPLAHEGSA